MDTSKKEVSRISQLLSRLGFDLEEEQPHISGERFLVAPNKLVLVGSKKADGIHVIIKISRLVGGKEEIRQEKKVRDTLSTSVFSKKGILFPKEIYFGRYASYLILVTEFIPQEQVFVSYPLEKQFAIILQAFRAQEVFPKSKIFPVFKTKEYLEGFKAFRASILQNYHTAGMEKTLKTAWETLKDNEAVIEKYCNHLVHGDFVPHNFRIRGNSIYMLDHSAFHLGNKYEEWARLLNYMVIHNPALEKKLKEHVLNKPDESEYFDLKLMRIYKIGYLLKFYGQSLAKTSSDLHALTSYRLNFWEEVMKSILDDKAMDEKILKAYIKNRDSLRSAEEKKRQREFAIA